jgi:transcriptional antiterminator RfaH
MPLENPHYQWYAIYTRANDEKKLFNNLREKKIECYLPTRKVQKYWNDSKKLDEVPYLRCYVFVRVSYREFFTALNTPGVVCFISSGGKAQSIPESQINNIKMILSQTNHEIGVSHAEIQKGLSVEVLHGSLKGIHGEFVSIFGQSRLLIRLASLNCSLYVNISKDEVRVLEEKHEQKEPVFAIPSIVRSIKNRSFQTNQI